MLLFMSLYPSGLTHDDIALLCEMFKQWFGDYKPLQERMFKAGKTAPVFNQISSTLDFVDSKKLATNGKDQFFLQSEV